jgi:hypothetical protein
MYIQKAILFGVFLKFYFFSLLYQYSGGLIVVKKSVNRVWVVTIGNVDRFNLCGRLVVSKSGSNTWFCDAIVLEEMLKLCLIVGVCFLEGEEQHVRSGKRFGIVLRHQHKVGRTATEQGFVVVVVQDGLNILFCPCRGLRVSFEIALDIC